MSRRRVPARTKRPDPRPKPWGDQRWTSPVTPPTGPSLWAWTEARLRELADAGATVSGSAGVWTVEWPDGLVVTVSAETDAEIRAAREILR